MNVEIEPHIIRKFEIIKKIGKDPLFTSLSIENTLQTNNVKESTKASTKNNSNPLKEQRLNKMPTNVAKEPSSMLTKKTQKHKNVKEDTIYVKPKNNICNIFSNS